MVVTGACLEASKISISPQFVTRVITYGYVFSVVFGASTSLGACGTALVSRHSTTADPLFEVATNSASFLEVFSLIIKLGPVSRIVPAEL